MSLKLVTFFCLFLCFVKARRFRILGGNEANPHEFPHMITLNHVDAIYHSCGGGILNKNWIITAGHCVSNAPKGSTFKIKAGKHSLGAIEDTEQVINIKSVFRHENYTRATAPNDIALLKLENPLVLNEYVKAVILPESHSEIDGNVVFSGWGRAKNSTRPDKLQKANFIVIDLDSCKKFDESIFGLPSVVTSTMLCAKSSSTINGTFACTGDSGSPLITEKNGQITLVGVFSWLYNPCGQVMGAPSVFTKVSSHIDWIQKIIANN